MAGHHPVGKKMSLSLPGVPRLMGVRDTFSRMTGSLWPRNRAERRQAVYGVIGMVAGAAILIGTLSGRSRREVQSEWRRQIRGVPWTREMSTVGQAGPVRSSARSRRYHVRTVRHYGGTVPSGAQLEFYRANRLLDSLWSYVQVDLWQQLQSELVGVEEVLDEVAEAQEREVVNAKA